MLLCLDYIGFSIVLLYIFALLLYWLQWYAHSILLPQNFYFKFVYP